MGIPIDTASGRTAAIAGPVLRASFHRLRHHVATGPSSRG
jgi:hypothetical protein